MISAQLQEKSRDKQIFIVVVFSTYTLFKCLRSYSHLILLLKMLIVE
jgi:hypothetical protein